MGNNELKHFGILGMKWGIRRYQNPDGTLTEEGRRRYGKSSDSDGTWTKRVSDMTDEELSSTINRLRNEKAYKDLMKDLYPEKVTLMDTILKKLKNETIPNTISDAVKNTATSFVDKVAGAKIDEYLAKNFETVKDKQNAERASNRLNAANKNQLADLLNKGFITPYNDKSDKAIQYTDKGKKWLDTVITPDDKKKDKK